MDESKQQWLFALSAPIVAMCRDVSLSCTSHSVTDTDPPTSLHQFRCSDREELLEDVETLMHLAGNNELSTLYRRWHQLTPGTPLVANDAPCVDQSLAEFVSQTAVYTGPAGIAAWYLARAGLILRLGFGDGLITEDESLWLHCQLSHSARGCYRSWSAYVYGFLMGRAYWQSTSRNADFPPEHLVHSLLQHGSAPWFEHIVRALLQPQDSPLSAHHWSLSCDEPPRPSTLAEEIWS
ncbi:DUF1266 domain-containing protein [Pokkaliibacter sp. CJK22405]|uniref:DUF1266 domain-containing protein n=1 Tax=Pokkaliibacter sp. CJK22405 TaxID=3384615 RepID=UPI0039848173